GRREGLFMKKKIKNVKSKAPAKAAKAVAKAAAKAPVKASAKASAPAPARTRWDAQWDKQLSHLVKFHDKHGRWPKASEEFPKGNRIGLWANRQRDLRERGELDTQRVAALQKAGFEWNKTDARGMHWDEQYAHLIEFRRRNKDR